MSQRGNIDSTEQSIRATLARELRDVLQDRTATAEQRQEKMAEIERVLGVLVQVRGQERRAFCASKALQRWNDLMLEDGGSLPAAGSVQAIFAAIGEQLDGDQVQP